MARTKPKRKRAKPAPKPRSKPKAKPAPKPRAKPKAAQKPRQAPRKGAGKATKATGRRAAGTRDSKSAGSSSSSRAGVAPHEAREPVHRKERPTGGAGRDAGPARSSKPTKAELRKLAKREWSDLKKREQAALRSWRGHKAAETVFRAKHERMAEELSGTHGRAARDEARRRIREEGSAGLARWLKNQSGLPRGKERSAEVRRRFAFWMYSP